MSSWSTYNNTRNQLDAALIAYFNATDSSALNNLYNEIRQRYSSQLQNATLWCNDATSTETALKRELESLENERAGLNQTLFATREAKVNYEATYCYTSLFFGQVIDDYQRQITDLEAAIQLIDDEINAQGIFSKNLVDSTDFFVLLEHEPFSYRISYAEFNRTAVCQTQIDIENEIELKTSVQY